MPTLSELLAQQAELSKQIEEIRQVERKDAITQILKLISDYNLTQEDLFNSNKAKKITTKSPAMYRDPVSNKEWTGKGQAPSWMPKDAEGRKSYLIVQPS
jgi:DNA-binding protein H-NS